MKGRPTRDTPAGQAYLELQRLARSQGRLTGDVLTMYVIERWLARLAQSRYVDDFILKGGILLASLGARRPTADADALVRNMGADQSALTALVVEIASIPIPEDGVDFDTESVQSEAIREGSLY